MFSYLLDSYIDKISVGRYPNTVNIADDYKAERGSLLTLGLICGLVVSKKTDGGNDFHSSEDLGIKLRSNRFVQLDNSLLMGCHCSVRFSGRFIEDFSEEQSHENICKRIRDRL